MSWASQNKSSPCVVASACSVSVSGCEFRGDAPQVFIGERVRRAVVTGNVDEGAGRVQVQGGSGGRPGVVVANNAGVSV
jgi:hypothetical protein